MVFRSLILRLKSVRKRRDEGEEFHEDEDVDDPAAKDEPLPEAQDSTQPSVVDASKPVRGLRKATVPNERQLSQADRRRSISNAEPSDYLYFGEGVLPADVSQSLLNRSRRKSANDSPQQLPAGTYTRSRNSGKDSSGFLTTELSTHTAQMGYSHLTYGGSLQYDYAGTQG
ncbi:hypothetical protein F4818DRAFT_430622 [Hypoxylon cercidicola]|nr:hypothetical protein F4818DRAFT_430622 [Hypoxylon cercidicola]